MRLGTIAYIADKAREAGFDGSTEAGRTAWYYATYPHMRRATGRPAPPAEVISEPAPPASDDPLAVYLPASAQAILRAQEIAAGRVTPLPVDPVARAIIAADRRAREPGSDPL